VRAQSPAANRITNDGFVTDSALDAVNATGFVVRSVPLGGGSFSRALQSASLGDAWLAKRPRSVSAWREHVNAVRDAQQGGEWLAALSPAFAATGRASDRLTRAAAAGVVVTTGQQPGLFGGPAYTWSKAIGALAMADALQAACDVPVAPVFWAASDDADWMEAAVTHVVTSIGLTTLSLDGPPTDGIAMADVALGEMSALLAQLRAASGSIAHADILGLVEAAYVPHATVGGAYVQLLRALLEPLGIAVLDAAHPAVKNAADPFLRHALGQASIVADALAERTATIRASGHAPQVDAIDDLSLVFRTQLGVSGRSRDRVRERVPVKDVARVAREAETGTLGANVLLRPVLERALMPTVTYMAGPGEYAYFAQVSAVASALGVAQPIVSPRWAGEVIDNDAFVRIERLGIAEGLLHDPHSAESELARRSMSENVQDALERLRVATDTQLRAVRDAISDDEGLVSANVIAGLERDIAHRLSRFERRLLAGIKRRESELMRQIAVVRASFRPGGSSPERVINLMPILIRYGPSVFAHMHAEALTHARALVHGASAPA